MNTDLEKLNRFINYALRAVIALVEEVKAVGLEPVQGNVRTLANVLTDLAGIQNRIYSINPELEYHYDETRSPTRYMEQFRARLDQADSLSRRGKTDAALDELRAALDMEPPPLTHELLVEKIRQVASNDS